MSVGGIGAVRAPSGPASYSSPGAAFGGAVTPTGHHRPKKGMATAKQRLGKILKIHKMIH